MSNIDPALTPLIVPMDTLELWANNYRQGDVGSIVESLKAFGQKKPIVVQASTRMIVAGNHLFRAAQFLGWTEIAVVLADLNDADAIRYAIADNRTSDLATNDEGVLAALLSELVAQGGMGMLDGTGYDGEDLDAMLKAGDDAAERDSDLGATCRCPSCGNTHTRG